MKDKWVQFSKRTLFQNWLSRTPPATCPAEPQASSILTTLTIQTLSISWASPSPHLSSINPQTFDQTNSPDSKRVTNPCCQSHRPLSNLIRQIRVWAILRILVKIMRRYRENLAIWLILTFYYSKRTRSIYWLSRMILTISLWILKLNLCNLLDNHSMNIIWANRLLHSLMTTLASDNI
jgi:hypothetical protein